MGQPYTEPETMKAVNYTLTVKEVGADASTAWKEQLKFFPDWEDEGWTPEQDAQAILTDFNASLRTGENPRELVTISDVHESDEPIDFNEPTDEEE